MANPANTSDLERLEDEIDEALLQCSPDDKMIVELRRCQSHLKEEIERLRHEPTTTDEPDELLCCRMAMLGLDPYVLETGDHKTFDQIKRRCTCCEFREACTEDLKCDPNNPVWESYCPNSMALNALTEAWWFSNVV